MGNIKRILEEFVNEDLQDILDSNDNEKLSEMLFDIHLVKEHENLQANIKGSQYPSFIFDNY